MPMYKNNLRTNKRKKESKKFLRFAEPQRWMLICLIEFNPLCAGQQIKWYSFIVAFVLLVHSFCRSTVQAKCLACGFCQTFFSRWPSGECRSHRDFQETSVLLWFHSQNTTLLLYRCSYQWPSSTSTVTRDLIRWNLLTYFLICHQLSASLYIFCVVVFSLIKLS